ncbi:MAG: transporter [Bacteroidota bacterium]
MYKLISIVILFFVSISVFSQEIHDIETDRPDQTECSSVIPRKTIQIETGILQESDKADVSISKTYFPTSLLRIGALSKVEFRIIAGEYFIAEIKDSNMTYNIKKFSPFSLGTKVFICNEKKIIPQTSLLFHVNHDSGKFLFDRITYDFRFSMSHTFSEKISLGYNLGGEWNRDENNFTLVYTLSTAFSVSEKLGAFIEVFGNITKKKLPTNQFDGGITFLIRKNLQADCSAGIALNKNSPDKFVSAGLSLRIPE